MFLALVYLPKHLEVPPSSPHLSNSDALCLYLIDD